MKKRIFALSAIFLFLIFSLFPFPFLTAKADGDTYACILSESVYFYASDDEKTELFILPKTYYVKVLEKGKTFTKVEYLPGSNSLKPLHGYCKTAALTFVAYQPSTPYLDAKFQVTYTVDGYAPSDPLLSPVTFECNYCGEYSVGSKKYAYVLRGEEFTYVPLPSGFTYPLNDEHLTKLPSDSSLSSSSAQPQPANGGQTALLILLAILIPILAALILKPTKKKVFDVEE